MTTIKCVLPESGLSVEIPANRFVTDGVAVEQLELFATYTNGNGGVVYLHRPTNKFVLVPNVVTIAPAILPSSGFWGVVNGNWSHKAEMPPKPEPKPESEVEESRDAY